MAVEFIDYNFTVEVNEDTNVVEIRYEGLNADNLALLTTRVDVLEDAFALQSGTTTGTISGIQSDITALEAADITLQNNITAETNARIAADAALANSITLVAPPLQANIDAEAAARVAADAAEVVARNAAISAATAPIIADAVALEGTVNSHTASISAIAADQVTVNANVAALDASFDALSADFAAWSANFTDVQDAVTAETAARIAADAAITAMITVPVSWKAPVRATTTAAGTLATDFEVGDVVDGVTLALGDRILIKNQAAGAENGIYTVNTTGAPTRATDMDSSSEVPGAITLVAEGTTNGDTLYFCSTNSPITLGTTALVFTQVSGGTNDGDKGDITVSAGGTTWTIDAGAVTLAKMANLATGTIIGRATAGTGVPEALTGAQATALLDTFTSGAKGLAPASGGGSTNFLRADGTWAVPAGGGGGGGGGGSAIYTGASLKFNADKAVTINVPWVWDATEWDTDSYWNVSTPSRLTIPAGKAGKYLVLASSAPTAANDYGIELLKNGTVVNSSYGNGAYQQYMSSVMLDLAEGDYIQLQTPNTGFTALATRTRLQLFYLNTGSLGSANPLNDGAELTSTVAQSIGNALSSPKVSLTFDTEVRDDGGYANLGTNNDRFTITNPGWYIVTGAVQWDSPTTGSYRALEIWKNGTTFLANHTDNPDGVGYIANVVSAVHYFSAGDYVQLRVYQDSGGAVNIMANSQRFAIHRLGVASLTPGNPISDGAYVTRAVNQAISAATWTNIGFDTEVRDDHGYWESGNPERLTIPETGWYVVNVMTSWDGAVTQKGVYIGKNGPPSTAANIVAATYPITNAWGKVVATHVGYFTTGDYLQFMVYADSGGTLVASGASAAAMVSIHRLGVGSTPANPVNDGAFIYRAANAQSIPNAAHTALTFDTELKDDNNYSTASSSIDRLVAPNTGWYVVTGTVRFAANGTGIRSCHFRVNGNSSQRLGQQQFTAVSGSADTVLTPTVVVYLNAGDIVQFFAYQDSGGALTASIAQIYQPGFSIHRLGTNQLPVGGTTGQALVKKSDANGDVKWDTVQQGTTINYYDSHDPAAMSLFFCDFIGAECNTWAIYGATGGYVSYNDTVRVDGRPGIAVVGSGGSNATSAAVIRHTSAYNTTDRANTRIPSGSDELSLEWCGKFSSISQTNGYMRFGLVENVTTYNNSIYVDVQAGTVKLQCYSGGVNSNATFSTLPAADTFCHIEIRANTTSARAYLNGVLVATVTTNLPTAGLDIVLQAGNLSGAADRVMTTDYVRLRQVYGTPRATRQSSTQYSIVGDAVTHVDAPPPSPESVNDEFEGDSLNSKWAWDNQSTGTAVVTGGALKLTAALSASMSVQSLFQPLPSSGDWKYRAKIAIQPLGNTNVAGITMKETATGKLVSFMLVYSSQLYHQLVYFTNSTTYSSTPASLSGDPMMFGGMPWIYYEIEKVGTTLYFRFSRTGVDGSWYNHSNASLTAHFTTGPNLIGLSAASQNASVPAMLQCEWFRKIDPAYTPGKLTVNGKLQPATFQYFDAKNRFEFYDDFINRESSSELGYAVGTANGGSVTLSSFARHPGVWRCSTSANNAGYGIFSLSRNGNIFVAEQAFFWPTGADELNFEACVRMNALFNVTNPGVYRLGFIDQVSTYTHTCYLNFDSVGPAFAMNGGSGGSNSVACTGTIVANTWIRVRIKLTATEAVIYFDDVQVARVTDTTKFTASGFTPFFFVQNTGGTGVDHILDVDYLRVWGTVTRN